jgi:hypothetical protein
VAAAAAALLAVAVALVTRGDARAPDAAARLVPADALLYAHLATDPGRTQDARLQTLAGRFGTVQEGLRRLAMEFTPSAGGLDFARDVRPWLGSEVAVALVPGAGGRPVPMLLAAVRDRAGAEALLRRLGAASAGAYRGVALRRLPPRTTAAFAGDFLVAGPEPAVRAAIDRSAGAGGPALAGSGLYRRAAERREGAGGLDVFAPAAGVRRLLDGRRGLAAVAARLLPAHGLEGISVQAGAEERGILVTARLLRARGQAPPDAFTPTLADRAPANAAAWLALPGLDAAAGLLARTGGGSILGSLREGLPQAAGVELDDLLAPLRGEAALTVTSGAAAPVFTLTARTSDEARTREDLAQLQEPLSRRLAGGTTFAERDAGGAQTFSLPVTPELQPSYAVARGTVVASTGRAGLAQLDPARTPVTGTAAWDEIRPDEDAQVEALGFFAPRELLALGERTGLEVPGSPAARDDLRRLRAAAAVVEGDAREPTDTTAELFLEIP